MDHQKLEGYWARVKAIAWLAGDYLPAESLLDAHRLIDYDEPSEGLRLIAWAIVNERVHVPASLISAIRQYSRELILEEDMPPNLDQYALPEATGR